ncbi:MAG TPA: hypothetical protein VJK02_01960, partial [Anaerolineales bacterium]|nr:hypothetical protein [Anaerolineales bacterium]
MCTGVTIPDNQSYTFSVHDGITDSATVSSRNVFKRDPRFAGVVTEVTADGEEPLAGLRVELDGPTNGFIGAVRTDEDGIYLFVYKHTGRAATYTIRLPAYGIQKTVT